ncbi:prepilin-type N-terminal cleavage/methylation domain-containing protein [Kineococcus xinjiangensis]|uniref:Prepilin-type N-terminal cleavage/methylation domain-containing protein n=1 Tax=Kineococcus xinjiangensis TaxID=512762 RepID=A0A2S6IP13_9ACTN|nr:Ig-like domain-containing protein [Kineococcus xinjiangensis]PPK95997.1 prepilin-type N-terminal cleavage/methylation domain-containing protein [Kineococcus xinjiangensis]
MHDTCRTRRDDGFSLVEVIVALALLGAVLAGVATLFLSGMRTTTNLDRRQMAVTVAGQQMELVRSVLPRTEGSVSALVRGRTAAAVDASWNAAPTDFQRATGKASDPAALAGATPVVPFETPVTLDGTNYTARTYIGTCERQAATPDRCSAPAGATPVAPWLYRVAVVVTWTEKGETTCAAGNCEHVLTTLIDPTKDPVFNTGPPTPVANPDSVSIAYKTATNIAVRSNDRHAALASVEVLTTDGNGTATVTADNRVLFTPKAGFAGDAVFTYRLHLETRVSAPALVTVAVAQPVFVVGGESATVARNQPVSFDVLANDTIDGLPPGTGTTVEIVSAQSGSASVAGGTVTFTPAYDFVGTATFKYRLVYDGFRSPEATGVITYFLPPFKVADDYFSLVRKHNRNSITIDVLRNDTWAGLRVKLVVVNQPPEGFVTVNSDGTLTYTTKNPGWNGIDVFTYEVEDDTGRRARGIVYMEVTKE